jgi:ABC-type amino acid transport substrate-binding protein
MFSSKLRAVALAAVTITVAACGAESEDGGQRPVVASNATLAAKLPDAVRAQGTLTVAADATFPPNEFLAPDGKTVKGMSADLAAALGDVLDIRVKLVNAPFDSILPGLATGKYDLGISSFTDTKEREQAVDFVSYYSAGTSFFVRADGGPAIGALADLCGHTVAVLSRSVYAMTLTIEVVLSIEIAGIAIPKGSGMAEPVLHAIEALKRGDCACAGDEPEAHALRRADVGAGPRARGRRPRGHAAPGP